MLTHKDSKNKHLHQKSALNKCEHVTTCKPHIRPKVKKKTTTLWSCGCSDKSLSFKKGFFQTDNKPIYTWMILKFWQDRKQSEGRVFCSEDKGSRWAANVRTSYHLLAGPWSVCNVLLMRLSCGWVDTSECQCFYREVKGFPGVFFKSQLKRVWLLSCVNRRLSECAFEPGSSAASPASAATVRREETSCSTTLVSWCS